MFFQIPTLKNLRELLTLAVFHHNSVLNIRQQIFYWCMGRELTLQHFFCHEYKNSFGEQTMKKWFLGALFAAVFITNTDIGIAADLSFEAGLRGLTMKPWTVILTQPFLLELAQ